MVAGPALIIDPGSTTVIEAGWQAKLAEEGSLVLTRNEELVRERAAGGGACASARGKSCVLAVVRVVRGGARDAACAAEGCCAVGAGVGGGCV